MCSSSQGSFVWLFGLFKWMLISHISFDGCQFPVEHLMGLCLKDSWLPATLLFCCFIYLLLTQMTMFGEFVQTWYVFYWLFLLIPIYLVITYNLCHGFSCWSAGLTQPKCPALHLPGGLQVWQGQFGGRCQARTWWSRCVPQRMMIHTSGWYSSTPFLFRNPLVIHDLQT